MCVELSLFVAVFLTGWIFFAFFLEYINNRRNGLEKKEMHLERRRCEVCASAYFVLTFFEFWRCPLCGSINKEK